MKIAIISDIHENFHNLVIFLQKAQEIRVEKILCLWDLINGWIALTLAKNPIPTFMVWGNNDGDKIAITKTACAPESNLQVWFTTYDFLEIEWRKIFLSHYPLLAKPIAKSWDFDLVCFGHTHILSTEKIWECLLVNPWSLGSENACFAVYNTITHSLEIIALKWCISLKSELADTYREKIGATRQTDKSRTY